MRIHAAGVCGTDLHILDGMIKPDPYPMILGHEAAGVVEAAGEGVSLQPGDRVAIYNKIFCGYCEQCLKGRQNICDNEADQLGFNRDGGDAEYVVVPERNAVAVPDGVDLATAAVLTCAGMTAMHATKLSNLRIGRHRGGRRHRRRRHPRRAGGGARGCARDRRGGLRGEAAARP